jgi:hypothetical protein
MNLNAQMKLELQTYMQTSIPAISALVMGDPAEPDPEPKVIAVCPQRPLPSGMFPTEDSIYLFMNSEYPGCAVVISYYDNEQNNPSNIQGCASNYPLNDTTWQFEFYKEWNR